MHNILSAIVISFCLIHTVIGNCTEYSHKVDFDDTDKTIWTRDIPNFTMDEDLSLDGAGAGNIIVVSSNYHTHFDIDFQFATTVKNVSLRVLFSYNISIALYDTAKTTVLHSQTIQVPNFSWFTTEFKDFLIKNVGRVRITWVMDENGLEMGIKRLHIGTCPECPDSTKTIDYGNSASLTLTLTSGNSNNLNNMLAGSGKDRKFTGPRQLEATFNAAVTIQMVRLQIKVRNNGDFNVTMYNSTTASASNEMYAETVTVTGSTAWSNDLHVIPFSPIGDVELIVISFNFPTGTSYRVRNLAFDKCVSSP